MGPKRLRPGLALALLACVAASSLLHGPALAEGPSVQAIFPYQVRTMEGIETHILSPPPTPDDLHVVLGTAPHTCEDPFSAMDCTQTFRVSLHLPPALQHPGIIDLTDPAIGASFSRSWEQPAFCGPDELQSGPFEHGTIEILSIDETGLSCRVYGSTSYFKVRLDADGLYEVSACP